MASPWKHPELGIYYFRKAVPHALRAVVGRTEIRRSLGTKDPKEARRRHRAVAEEIESEWDRIRSLRSATDDEAPARLVSLSHKDAHALAGEIYLEQIAKHEHDPGDAVEWHRMVHLATNALPLDRRPEGAPKRVWTHAMRPEFVARREFGTLVSEHLDKRQLQLDSKSFTVVCLATAQAMRDAAAQLKRNSLGDYTPDPAASKYPAPYSPSTNGPPLQVEAFIADWIKGVPLSTATRQSWSGKLRNLMRNAGKTDIASITEADVVAWRNARLAAGISERTISEGDLAGVFSMFKWAVEEKKLISNPAQDVKQRFQEPEQVRPQKGYDFREADLVLRATLEDHSNLSEASAGARRWIPWLCAFSGARVGEIGQMHADHVYQEPTPSGLRIWCMLVTPEAGTVKNRKARVVPIHPQVIEQGFLAYVDKRKGRPLFYDPELARKPDSHHRQADKVGERLAAWVRKLGIPAPVQPNHAWRHRFETLGRALWLREDIVDYITGHGPNSAADNYGDYLVEASYRAVCYLPRYLEGPAKASPADAITQANGISILAGQDQSVRFARHRGNPSIQRN
ncbi:MAG TPA: DUF6538 domain-containing protein [Devosia sp.]|nr:DUF6538 domain-containing protein [Devosia sp.]